MKNAGFETQVFNSIQSLLQDVRFGARVLYRSPGFTAVAVLSLGLVIGANSTVFSVLNSVLLSPFPHESAERLVRITEVRVDQPERWRDPTLASFLEWSKNSQSFEQMGFANPWAETQTISMGDRAAPGEMQFVSLSLFSLLGVDPQLGRRFVPDDVSYHLSEAVIISDTFWRRHLGADPNILGERLVTAGNSGTIIGVLPPGFWIFPWNRDTDVWRVFNPYQNALAPGTRYFRALGRLRPEVSAQQAQLELEAIFQNLQAEDPAAEEGWRIQVKTIRDAYVADWKESFYLLFGIAILVLLIGCANVANMLLARARRREKEIAIRLSLGGRRFRLIRQLLTECILLAALGGILGIVLTIWGIQLFVVLTPDNWSLRQEEISIDGNVVIFTVLLSLLTGLLFGLVPALRASGPDLHESLKEGGRRSTGGSHPRIRSLFVVTEVTLALVLLLCAGLMVNSFIRLQNVDPGYDPSNLLRAVIIVQGQKYMEQIGGDMKRVTPQVDVFWRELQQRTEALPGVESAAVAGAWGCGFRIVGASSTGQGQPPRAICQAVSPNYFSTLEIPLLRGRTLSEQDVEGSGWVAVINEALARQYFPNEDPIGRLLEVNFGGSFVGFSVDEGRPREIVGVIGDIRHWGLGWEPQPSMYVPHRQHIWEYPGGQVGILLRKWLLVRTATSPMNLAPLVEKVVGEIDRDQAPVSIMTMKQALSESIGYWRFWMQVFGFFAAMAVILVVVGIYGVMSYAVTERTHEIGVRMAMGAQRTDVLGLVVRQGLKLTLIGVAIGAAVALGVTRLISSYLYGVNPTDPLTFGIVSMLVIAVAIAACYIPARWATKVDPLVALRYE